MARLAARAQAVAGEIAAPILDHRRVPILNALRAYRESGTVPFSTPGHKAGGGADDELAGLLGRDLFASDVWLNTARFGSLLREAEALGADAWGAERTFYLVNGSTSGNLACLLAALGPGDEVIVARDMHRSLLAALVMSGARPVYLAPRIHPELDISLGVAAGDVAAALDAHPAAKLVALVSPTYYGVAADLPAVAAAAHLRGVPIHVDEAWGAHFAFHPALPPSAMQSGADAAVTSAHKLLGSLSQAAMLHLRGDRIDSDRVTATVAMVQTTSPLLPILASIDTARRQMALDGTALLGSAIELAKSARRRLRALPGIDVLDARHLEVDCFDVTRLVIDVTGLGISGYAAEHVLRERCAIAPEMSDRDSVVCLVTIGDRPASIDRLVDAFATLASDYRSLRACPRRHQSALGEIIASSRPVLTPAEAFQAPSRPKRLDDAEGDIAAEAVIPYPPGVPLILPGEVITRDKVEYVRRGIAQGMALSGASDASLATIRVVD